MKNHVFCYNFSSVNACEIGLLQFIIFFLLDIQYATFYIENRSVKRANSPFTICPLLTLTRIIF